MKRFLPLAILVAVLSLSFAVRSRNLGAMSLTHWDESYHALVARNLLRHPLTPTLIDNPAFESDVMPLSPQWAGASVWFHKGTLPLWIGAAGMAVTGPVPIGFRGASLLLSLGSAALLFLLGKRLFNARTGLFAAALLAVNPYFTGQIHGIMLTDIVDSTLLFFVLAGLLALAFAAESGKALHAAAAGAATALAFMSKYYLGLVVPAVGFLLVLADHDGRNNLLSLRIIAAFTGAALAILGPWAGYNLIHFPNEFRSDVVYYIGHLTTNSENWGAPWDRFVFDYLPNAARDAFVPGLFAGAVLWTMPGRRRMGVSFAGLWLLAAAVPHALARTKVPSYGVLASPALILLTAALLDEALRYNVRALAVASGAFAAAIFSPPYLPGILCWGRGPGPGHSFFGIAAQKTWIWNEAMVTVAVAALTGLILTLTHGAARARIGMAFKALCIAGAGVIFLREIRESRALTWRHPSADNLLAIADFARTTAPGAVFFLAPGTVQHTAFMFYADRTGYPAGWRHAMSVLSRIPADRPVYILSRGKAPSPVFTAPDGSSVSRLR